MMKRLYSVILSLTLLVVSFSMVTADDNPGTAPAKRSSAREVQQVLERYKAGMEAMSLEQLDPLMDSALLVLEHGGKDVGWPAYRDGHLGEHMKEWKSFRVSNANLIESTVFGDWAYAAQESLNTIVMAKDGTTVALKVTETFVMKRHSDGWKIKHLHVSLKKKS